MESKYLVRNHRRYSCITPGALYETQVQNIVKKSVDAIFPGFELIDAEPYFVTAAGDVRPDFLMLARDLSAWAVVEVELGIHSFSAHVLPQLTKLTFARSDDKVISKVKSLSRAGHSDAQIATCLELKPRVYLVTQGSSAPHTKFLDELKVEVLDINLHEALDAPNEYLIEVIDRSAQIADLGCNAVRSPSPLTPNIWTVESSRLLSAIDAVPSVMVRVSGTESRWGLRPAANGVILVKPTDLDIPVEFVLARVFWDEESKTLHLID